MAVQFLGGVILLLAAFLLWNAARERHPVPLLVGVGIFMLCGAMLFAVGRSLNRPRLRAARDLQTQSLPDALHLPHVADQERLTDGMPIQETQALWLRSQTRIEQGRAVEALPDVAERLRKHPGCLALHEIAFNVLWHLGRTEEALSALDSARGVPGIGEATRVVLAHHEVGLLARAGRTDEAVAAAERALAGSGDRGIRTVQLDLLASLPLLAAHGEFLTQADSWSAEALELDPSPTIRATRGGVLCEMGRVDEAEPLLRTVVAEATEAVDLGLAHLYLALLEHHRGNRKAAQREAWAAFCFYPDRRLVERLASDGLASG
jgi:tetratricopeptide (TPR) repeat protein